MVGKRTHLVLILAVTAICAHAVEYTRDRYNVIVERAPFGEDPQIAVEDAKDAQQAREAAAAAQRMEKDMRLCYLLEAESGEIRAGFEDLKAPAGKPQSIMLMVNESFKGMKLTSIDLERSSATLELNGTPVTFELKKVPVAATPAPRPARSTPRRFGGGFRSTAPPTPAAKPKEPEEPELTPEEQAQRRKEVRERLENYQLEVIREGMPPLPIPLTQEMDDQLVAEGVLPPAE